MDNGSLFSLMDFCLTAGGLYVIYHTIAMLRGGSLADNPLIAKDLRTRKCRDAAGYVGYVGIRQLIFGLAALLCGIIGLVYDFTGLLGGIVYYICFAFCLIVFLWYCIVIRKATKKFW